jgi:hypothetical protein
MNMKELIIKHLKSIKATGLSDGYGCGCGIDDLEPCGAGCMSCVPAKRHRAKEDGRTYSKGDWIYVPMEPL